MLDLDVRPARPKEFVQNVRARAVIAAIAPESGPNRTGCRRILCVEPALLNTGAASASASTRSASHACEIASWQGSSRAMPVDVSRAV